MQVIVKSLIVKICLSHTIDATTQKFVLHLMPKAIFFLLFFVFPIKKRFNRLGSICKCPHDHNEIYLKIFENRQTKIKFAIFLLLLTVEKYTKRNKKVQKILILFYNVSKIFTISFKCVIHHFLSSLSTTNIGFSYFFLNFELFPINRPKHFSEFLISLFT